jgi:hypothetical protein
VGSNPTLSAIFNQPKKPCGGGETWVRQKNKQAVENQDKVTTTPLTQFSLINYIPLQSKKGQAHGKAALLSTPQSITHSMPAHYRILILASVQNCSPTSYQKDACYAEAKPGKR